MEKQRTLVDLQKLAEEMKVAQSALEAARQERDEMIKELRLTTRHTIAELAAAAGCSLATVKAVLRGLR